jgi:hypothetical protein
LRAIDRAATAVPDTPAGREQIASQLAIARHQIRAAMALPEAAVDATELLELSAIPSFLEAVGDRPSVWYTVTPLPKRPRLRPSEVLRGAMPRLVELIVETINDGHINDPWMHPGDFDWSEHEDFVEVTLVRSRRAAVQSLVLNSEGVVGFRDTGIVRGHYRVPVYQAMIEATCAFAARVFNEFGVDTPTAAIQTHLVGSGPFYLDVIRGAGTAWLRPTQSGRLLSIPKVPLTVPVERLTDSEIATPIVEALTALSVLESAPVQ